VDKSRDLLALSRLHGVVDAQLGHSGRELHDVGADYPVAHGADPAAAAIHGYDLDLAGQALGLDRRRGTQSSGLIDRPDQVDIGVGSEDILHLRLALPLVAVGDLIGYDVLL